MLNVRTQFMLARAPQRSADGGVQALLAGECIRHVLTLRTVYKRILDTIGGADSSEDTFGHCITCILN